MKLTSIFPYLPKNFFVAIASVLSIFALTTVVLAAYGPERPTKEYYQGVPGFDHVTFNSFTNVPNVGDEREFYHGKIAGSSGGFYDPMTQVRNGDELLVRVYIHNNADKSLNESGEGVAKNVNVRIAYDAGEVAKNHTSTAYISADNAQPSGPYFDTLDFSAENGGAFELVPVAGSGQITTNEGTSSIDVNQLVSENGVNIGDINGCFEYVTLVTMKFEVKMPRYEIEKSVRFEGQTSDDWKQEIAVESGDSIEYLIEFKNTGSTKLNSVVVMDKLPEYVTYVPGSTKLYNATYPSGKTVTSDAIIANGINIGNYSPGANAYVLFKATVDEKHELTCDNFKLTNLAYAAPAELGRVSDGAAVTLANEPCEEPENPVYRCDAVNIIKLDGREIRADVTTTAAPSDLVKLTGFNYNFGDGTSLDSTKSSEGHTYSEDGAYKITVTAKFDVDGEVKTDVCTGEVKFSTDPITPTEPELPNTGPGSFIAALFGASTLGASVRSWLQSKRALKSAMLA